MSRRILRAALAGATLMLTTLASAEPTTLWLQATDGVEIRGDLYALDGDDKRSAPVILLFHQAGSNRGEYAEIAPRLNELGFHALAIDQRSGGKRWGFENETVGIDHNFQVVGDRLYIASYTSGTRVLHIGRDGNDDVVLEEVGTMDTEPRLPGKIINIKQEERFGSAFLGQWGIFVFDSGTIIASDINNGLIVMEESATPCKGMKCSK